MSQYFNFISTDLEILGGRLKTSGESELVSYLFFDNFMQYIWSYSFPSANSSQILP